MLPALSSWTKCYYLYLDLQPRSHLDSSNFNTAGSWVIRAPIPWSFNGLHNICGLKAVKRRQVVEYEALMISANQLDPWAHLIHHPVRPAYVTLKYLPSSHFSTPSFTLRLIMPLYHELNFNLARWWTRWGYFLLFLYVHGSCVSDAIFRGFHELYI